MGFAECHIRLLLKLIVKILHYNIWNGMTEDPSYLSRFAEYLGAQSDLQLLMLNEYRKSPRLDGALADCGFRHSCINECPPNRNRVAVFARVPLGKTLAMPGDLRLVMIRLEAFDLVAYHASPSGVAAVLQEIGDLLPMLDAERPTLLCGDLNSLSTRDRQTLDYDSLSEETGAKRYCLEGSLNFTAMERLRAAGFQDNRDPGRCDTVPTRIGRKSEQGIRLRLDYCFSRNLPVQAACVLDRPPFPDISDHYPLHITLREESHGNASSKHQRKAERILAKQAGMPVSI